MIENPHGEEYDIFFNIINRFIGMYSLDAAKNSTNDATCEYPFVAMDPRQVFAQLAFCARLFALDQADPRLLSEERKPSFLDVGCGIGHVLLMAEQFGFAARGIEKDDYSLAIAKRLLGEDRVSRADIWSYEKYSDFEVIYYFRPFCARDQQLLFEKMIEDKMKPGAILIANHKNSDFIDQDWRFSRICLSLPIWRKNVYSEEENTASAKKKPAFPFEQPT